MQFGVSEKGRVFASVEVRFTFIYKIKVKQFKDAKLNKIQHKVMCGEAQDAKLDTSRVLRVDGSKHRVDDIIPNLLVEANVLDTIFIYVQPRCTVT